MGDFILFLNVIIGILLVTNSTIRANLFLGITFFLNGFQGFSHQMIVNRASVEIAALVFLNSAPVSFLLGPSLYFYIKLKLNPNFRLRIAHLAHLLPAVLCLLLLIPYLSTSYAEKQLIVQSIRMNPPSIFNVKFALGTSSIFFFSRPIHILTYVFISLRLVFRNQLEIGKDKTPFQEVILKRWLKVLLYSFGLIYVMNLMNMFYGLYIIDAKLVNPFSILAGLIISFLNIQIFINPYILYGFNNVKYYSNDSFIARLYKVTTPSDSRYDKDWKIELMFKIDSEAITLKMTEKGYSLAKMADDLDIPIYHLNYYFKEIAKESFSDFKNKKRIQLAIDYINNGYLSTFTVENLSLKCGFSSRANFNNAFLKATGKSLKEYKNTIK